MDLSDEDTLKKAVESIFVSACVQLGIRPPTSEAMAPLIQPAKGYPTSELKNVDQHHLVFALEAVARSLAMISDGEGWTPDRQAITQALAATPCHYLWLC